MTATNSPNAVDSYNLLRSLGNYLEADVGITCGKITSNVSRGSGRQTIDADGYSIIVTISNIAPTEPSYPLIVFINV